ncbi:MAG: hypothetical protein VKP62_06135 [Candidatus Sericytochromatia bacterium]|nr:hypothetical protein [Candidatus Sericytochromatia bacterium]
MSGENEPKVTISTLRKALEFLLEDDNMIDRLEATALQELILRDGVVSQQERAFLQEAIAASNFDSQALDILKRLLASNVPA